MKRIVLYFPAQADPALGIPSSAHILPLSVLTVAAWPLHDGFEVVLVDGNVDTLEEAHQKVLAACDGALLFATTCVLGYAVADGLAVTRKVKQAFADLPCFIGGWFANALPEMQLATGLYDALVLGQGEITFRELVHALDRGESLDEIAGLALWREGRMVKTAPRRVVGWSELLDPPWHLVEWDKRVALMRDPKHVRARERIPTPPGHNLRESFTAIAYHSSYGCPLDCTFCCSPEMTSRKWKAVPAERMLDDIESLWQRWHFDMVHFFDANWGVTEKRVREFAQGLLERKLPIHYYAYVQADSICGYSQETLDLLAQSGLYGVVMGAETGSDETMKILRKSTRGENNIRAAQELDRRGVSVFASYLIGFPGESAQSMLDTIDQCRRMAIACPRATPSLWEYQPIPGAELYHKAIELGWKAPQSLEEWGAFLDYRWNDSPGFIPPEVMRMKRLYLHFTSISGGKQRGRIGSFERRAQARLQDAEGFARGWPGGLAEARAFHAWQNVEKRLPDWLKPKGEGIEKDWKTRTSLVGQVADGRSPS